MGSAVVVVVDVGRNSGAAFLEAGEAINPGTLLFEGANKSLAKAVLFRGVRSGVFLGKAIVFDQGAVALRAKSQAVIVPEGKTTGRSVDPAEAGKKRFLQSALGRFRAGGGLQGPAKDFAGAAVDNGHKGAPAIHAAIHHGDVGSPAHVGSRGNRRKCFNARPMELTCAVRDCGLGTSEND